MDESRSLQTAARAITNADAILVGAGAGMGVDSGLPDFRGNQGFWQAYPPYAKLGLDFITLANPRWFRTDPTLAWGFYGHRLNLYRKTNPHAGFQILKEWAEPKRHGAFVFTSNVDGHFQKAGHAPDRIAEIHGAIEWMQCLARCGVNAFPADSITVQVDERTMRAIEPLPRCPACGELARPNILMFNDWDWDETRTSGQQARLQGWLREVQSSKLVVIECGAGTAIPSVRRGCETIAEEFGALLIRINVREAQSPDGHVGLAMPALAGLRALGDAMQ